MNSLYDLRRIRDQAIIGGKYDLDSVLAAIPVRKIKRNKLATNVLENRKKKFNRLTDPQQARQLRAEFLPYSARAETYYSVVAAVTAYLRAHLNDRIIIESTRGRPEEAIVAGGKEKEKPYLAYYDEIKKATADGGRYLKIKMEKGGDIVQVNLAPITFSVLTRITTETGPVLEKKFKQLFGDFTLPSRYQRDDKTGQLHVVLSDYSTGLKPLSFYQKLNFPKDEASGRYQPDKLTLDKAFPKEQINATGIEVKIHHATMDDFRVPTGELAGPVRDFSIRITFRVLGAVTFPLEYALWATNVTDLTEFVPKIFREHFDMMGLMAVGRAKAKFQTLYARTMHIGTVKKINEQRIKDYSITIRPRVNKDGFTILKNGDPYFVPAIDRTDFYVETLRKSYDADTGEVKRNSQIPEIHDIPLMADWINDAFAYTDTNGQPASQLLSGAIALDDVTIFRSINTVINEYDQKILNNIKGFGEKICSEFSLYDQSADTTMNIARSYIALFNYIQTRYGDQQYNTLVAEAFDNASSLNPSHRRLIIEFVRLNNGIIKNFMNSKNYGIRTKCENLYHFYVFGPYAQQGKVYVEAHQNAREINAVVPEDKIPTNFKIPNLPGLTHILPHQGSMVAQSYKCPPLLVEEVDAGGGKTFMTLFDIIIGLEKGCFKRPLVICPPGLVKEWTTEVNKASQGKINVVPISSVIIKKLVKHLNYDRKRYLDYLQKAPINTIFVCSLNFLPGKTDYFTGETPGNLMQFGENYIRFFPNVQLLRQLNPDYIVLDESHYAKNAKALRTEAMFALSPVAKYRRVASGTMMQNDPTDNASQYGLLNPAIFKTKEDFLEKFGIEVRGKWTQLRSGAERDIAAARAPYAVRVKKSRRDWSHLLPIIRNEVESVEPTPEQRKFYDIILAEKIAEITNDPKVKKLLDAADEKGIEKLQKLLDKKLNVVEQFINAPDSNPGFVNRTGVRPEDLISPKVHAVNELIDKHMRGYTIRHDNGQSEKVPPDNNKIIVFCYNKVVSRHIWRHLEHQNIALHYAIKNPEMRRNAPSNAAAMTANEVLLRFRKDPKIKILIADETSLREGLNLQVASRVIRVQTLFSPGAQEQAMSRALRPDVEDVFKRRQITVDWLVCNFTFEIGKAARLISKMVSVFKVGEAENPKWNQFTRNTPIPTLELIRLNLTQLQEYTDPDHPGVKDYFQSYKTINDWEELQFGETQEHYRQLFAKKLGKRPEDINLRRDARIAMDGNGTLPGSKNIFVPLELGATPVDRRGLNLSALAILAPEEDEDESEQGNENDDEPDEDTNEDELEVEDVVTFAEDDLVQTEYGFGFIRAAYEGGVAVTKKGVRVVIPGFNLRNGQPYPIAFSRLSVFKPVPPDEDENSVIYKTWLRNVNQLKNDMKKAGKKGITFVEGYVEPMTTKVPLTDEDKLSTSRPPVKLPPHPAAKPPPKVTVIRDEDENENEDEKTSSKPPKKILQHIPQTPKQSDKNRPKFDFDFAVINGIPALTVYTDEEGVNLEALHDHGTWWPVDKFMNAHVQTYQGALNLVDKIKQTFPATGEVLLAGILNIAKKMRGTTTNDLRVRRQAVQFKDMKNFMKLGHTKVPNGQLRIYPYLLNDEMFVAAPISTQSRQTGQLRSLNIKGVSRFQLADPMAFHFGKNVATLEKYLKSLLDKGVRINGYNDTVEKLNDSFYHKLTGYEPLR